MATQNFNFLDKTGLSLLWNKAKAFFVAKEPGKGLSTNDLTDELVEKINNAGVSDFSGEYSDLTGKPQIEGHEVAAGNNTAASLGLATPSDITAATADMATNSSVDQKLTPYAKTTDVDSKIATATADMATETWVGAQGYATTSSVNSLISQAVSGAYIAKGSVAFASLPELSAAKVGDVYNVNDQFQTTADFVEGAGKTYSAGTNVVCVDNDGKKWDVLAGFIDTSNFVTPDNFIPITSIEIDEICK